MPQSERQRLDSVLRSLKLQAQYELAHGDHHRTLQAHAAELAKWRKRIA